MRAFVCLAVALLASLTLAGPKKRPAARPGKAKSAVVVDAPPAMAKLLQSTLGAQYAVTINTNALSDAPTTKEVRSVTAPVGARAVVLARAQGDAWTLMVLNGADGTPLDQQLFRAPARKPLKALPKDVAAALTLACATGEPPKEAPAAPADPAPVAAAPSPAPTPAPTPTPAPAAPTPVAAAEPARAASPTPAVSAPATPSAPLVPSQWPTVMVAFGFRGGTRSLSWLGDPDLLLSRYENVFIPQASLDATWYPGAPFTSGVLGNLGLHFSSDLIVGLTTRLKESSTRYGTRGERFRFDAAFRQPFGSKFSLEAVAGYTTQSFALDDFANDGSRKPALPNVAFGGPRAAVGARLMRLGPVGVDGKFGFTFLTGFGELRTDEYFPRARGLALDATVGVSVEVTENLHLRAGFEWTRYFVTLSPQDGSRFTATNAADQYINGAISALFVM